jgi:hypothetical protein
MLCGMQKSNLRRVEQHAEHDRQDTEALNIQLGNERQQSQQCRYLTFSSEVRTHTPAAFDAAHAILHNAYRAWRL